jgi:hypothetical protein
MTESSNRRIHIQTPDTDATMEASNVSDMENSSTETIKVFNNSNNNDIKNPKTNAGDYPSDEDDNDNDETTEEPLHPLFMDSLPKDYLSNPQLAAIASFLEDDDETEKEDAKNRRIAKPDKHGHPIIAPQAGGGKIGRSSTRRNYRGATLSGPYPKQDKTKIEQRKTSLGEMQLFLNMWKI